MSIATKESVKQEKTHEKDSFIKSENTFFVIFKRINKNPIARLSLYYILFNILIAIFYPLIIAYGPRSILPGNNGRFGGGSNAFPTLAFPGGTTVQGYDTFTQTLVGTEISLIVGFSATVITVVFGTIVGLLSGYYRGYVEEVLMRITDLILTLPFLVILLVLVAVFSKISIPFFSAPLQIFFYEIPAISRVQLIAITIGIIGWGGLARLVNASVKQVTTYEYIDAIKILGASSKRILFIHILPNVLTGIIILSALSVGGAILSEAGLSFLGFGDPTAISWGVQLSIARSDFGIHPEQALLPGFSIFFLLLAINLFSDALRDAFDPKQKE